jgi:hypothetical protein
LGYATEHEPRVEPVGPIMDTVPPLIVGLVSPRYTIWPAVPLNVYTPFWPGVDVVNVTGEPPAVMLPVMSGALYRFAVTLPV